MQSLTRFWNDKSIDVEGMQQTPRPHWNGPNVSWRHGSSLDHNATSCPGWSDGVGRPRLITRVLKSLWTYSVVALIGLTVHLEAVLPVYTITQRLFGWILLLALLYFLWRYANRS